MNRREPGDLGSVFGENDAVLDVSYVITKKACRLDNKDRTLCRLSLILREVLI